MPLECDFCGAIGVDLAILDFDGWSEDRLTCEECLNSDNGPAFSDLPSLKDRDRLIKKFTPLAKIMVKRHPDKDSEELFSGLSLELVKAANWHVKQSAYGDGSFYNVAKMRLGSFAATFENDGGNGVTLHDNHIDSAPDPEEAIIESDRMVEAILRVSQLDDENYKNVLLMTLAGMQQQQIATELNLDQSTISRWLRDAIVAIRQQSDHNRLKSE